MSHRASYWKTTGIALFSAAACIAGIAAVQHAGMAPALTIAATIGLLIVVTPALIVVFGGLVCLWRDSLQAEGRRDPLASLAVCERPPGAFRFLLGARLRPGDLVRVRAPHEIEITLDENGALEGLPYMSEMRRYSGAVYRVHRRVDYINDMRNKTGLRRIRGVVTLTDVRCAGSDHGGCQAECQILWKDTWLERVANGQHAPNPGEHDVSQSDASPVRVAAGEGPYLCQMTALWEASEVAASGLIATLRPWLCGNVGTAHYLIALLTRAFGWVQSVRRGVGFPYMPPETAKGVTPNAELQLQPGNAVIVRRTEEIAATLIAGRNRGLWFDRDMVRFCGQPGIVHRRVSRLIHEGTGKMVVMKTPALVLKNVAATGEFLNLCPQHEYIYWREIWLKRAGETT